MARAVLALAAMTFIVCCCLYSQVNGAGVLELQLRQIENFQLLMKHCCIGNDVSNCKTPCNITFNVCLTNYKSNHLVNDGCVFGLYNVSYAIDNFVSYTFDNTNLHNDIKYQFDFSWPGSLCVILRVISHFSTGESGVVMTTRWQDPSFRVGNHWRVVQESQNNAKLEYAVRVTCSRDFYGSDCKTTCVSRDDSLGHYTCDSEGDRKCLHGWTGVYCSEAVCNPKCKHGTCSSPDTCTCKPGWTGEQCDQCQRLPGCSANYGFCIKPMECVCKSGWGGTFCNRDLNFCTNHSPCLNGGTCNNVGEGGYSCSCPPGFTGTKCEVKLGVCQQQKCLNGGSCTDLFICQCPRGYHGDLCELVANDCSNQPCLNDGKCQSLPEDGGYFCVCQPGFNGYNCEIPSQPCASDPCFNGGHCVQNGTSFYCQCDYGFSGARCEVDVDDCHYSPCLNGGHCTDLTDGYQCDCPLGYRGRLCEEQVGCEAFPCANGAACLDTSNGIECRCTNGYTGADCSIRMDSCVNKPCMNGGLCSDTTTGYSCACPPHFSGQQCDTPVPVIEQSEEQPILDLRQLVLILSLGAGLPLLLICLIMIVMIYQRRRLLRAIAEQQRHNLHIEENQSNERMMNNRSMMIINDLGKGSCSSRGDLTSANKSLFAGVGKCADIHKSSQLLADYTKQSHIHKEVDDKRQQYHCPAASTDSVDGVKLREVKGNKAEDTDRTRDYYRRSKNLSTFDGSGATVALHQGKKMDNVTNKNINVNSSSSKDVDLKTSWHSRKKVFCRDGDAAGEQLISPDGSSAGGHFFPEQRGDFNDLFDDELPAREMLLNPRWLSVPPTSSPLDDVSGPVPYHTSRDTSVFYVDTQHGSRQYRSVMLATEV